MAGRPRDLPFSLIYWAEASGSFLLAGASGIEPGHSAAPRSIDFDATRPWPLGRVLRGAEPLHVHALKGFAELPTGAWTKPPRSSVLLPLKVGAGGSSGVFVAALNPFRKLDQRYRSFLGLIAGQIAAGISNAEAHAAERERAEKLAEIDRAKTQFFSNVSHEFRTPLTLLLSPVEQLLAQPQTEDTKASLQLARRNAHRLLRLVNSLLDLSRAEAGRLQTRYAATDACRASRRSSPAISAPSSRPRAGSTKSTPTRSRNPSMWIENSGRRSSSIFSPTPTNSLSRALFVLQSPRLLTPKASSSR